jgi:hypothetical protein
MTWFSQISWDETYGAKVSPSNSKDTLGRVHNLQPPLDFIDVFFISPLATNVLLSLEPAKRPFNVLLLLVPIATTHSQLRISSLSVSCHFLNCALCLIFLFFLPFKFHPPRTIPCLFFFTFIRESRKYGIYYRYNRFPEKQVRKAETDKEWQ